MNKLKKLLMFLSIISCILPNVLYAETTKPTISADAAIVMDANSKTVIYEKNADKIEYPASITKLMTALLTIETLEPTDVITFSKDAIYGIEPGSSHIGIKVDEQLTVDEALHGLLLMSANEVSNGLAEACSGTIENFAERMTLRAEELGAKNTHFVNPHGLHDENHYTTAYDMALIASYLVQSDYFLDIMQDFSYQIPPTNITDETRYLYQQHNMLNPNRNSNYYRQDVIGGKTGFTDQAKHTLVTMAKQGDTTLVAVVLKSDKATLYSDTNALLDYGFDAYHSLILHKPAETIKTLPIYSVQSGKLYQAGNCSIAVETPSSLLVSEDVTPADITTSLDLPPYIDTGTKEGDIIGEITYLQGSKILGKTNLIVHGISFSPAPHTTILPKESKLISNHWIYIALGMVFILLLLTIIVQKRRNRRRKRIFFTK